MSPVAVLRQNAGRFVISLAIAALVPGLVRASAQNVQPGVSFPLPGQGDVLVALVGTREIRLRDVEQYWQQHDPTGFQRTQRQVRDATARALEGLIGDYLLQHEAERKQVPIDQLLQQFADAAQDPTEDEIRDVYESSAAGPQGVTLQMAAPVITSYLKRQKSEEARQRHIEELKRSIAIEVRLPLDLWRETITIDAGDPQIGPPAAPVEIVAFSDFECPFCKQAAPVLRQLLSKYPEGVKLVWKDFPLPMHANARSAAEAAHCANGQGRFWEFHDVLFLNQGALRPPDLKRYATELGLNVRAFNECIEGGVYRDRVAAGLNHGKRHGVAVTPTVFINGRMVTGAVPFATYDRIVRDELARRRGPHGKR
jgi:protein-disulfide isomerase